MKDQNVSVIYAARGLAGDHPNSEFFGKTISVDVGSIDLNGGGGLIHTSFIAQHEGNTLPERVRYKDLSCGLIADKRLKQAFEKDRTKPTAKGGRGVTTRANRNAHRR